MNIAAFNHFYSVLFNFVARHVVAIATQIEDKNRRKLIHSNLFFFFFLGGRGFLLTPSFYPRRLYKFCFEKSPEKTKKNLQNVINLELKRLKA